MSAGAADLGRGFGASLAADVAAPRAAAPAMDRGATGIGNAAKAGRRRRALVLALYALALIVRLGYALSLTGIGDKDPADYDAYAWNLAQGNGFTNGETVARRPPLFPFLLAGVYRVFGHSEAAARLLQVVLGVALCAVCAALGRRLFGERGALVALTVAALHPYLVYYSGYLMTETLAALLFASLTWLALGWSARTPVAGFCACGALAGLAALSRSAFIGLPVLALAWAMAAGLPRRRAFGAALVFTLGMAAVVVPWTIRNYSRLGVVVPVQSDGGWQFYQYNLWYADDGFPTFAPERLREAANAFRQEHRALFDRFAALPEGEKDAVALREALSYFAAHPEAYLRSVLRKAYWFWRPSDFAIVSGRAVRLDGLFAVALYAPLLVLAALGLRPLPAAQRWTLIFAVAYLAVLHSLFFQGTPRFRFPIYPHLIALAAGGVTTFAAGGARRPSGAAA